jgi:hypothetical protein
MHKAKESCVVEVERKTKIILQTPQSCNLVFFQVKMQVQGHTS